MLHSSLLVYCMAEERIVCASFSLFAGCLGSVDLYSSLHGRLAWATAKRGRGGGRKTRSEPPPATSTTGACTAKCRERKGTEAHFVAATQEHRRCPYLLTTVRYFVAFSFLGLLVVCKPGFWFQVLPCSSMSLTISKPYSSSLASCSWCWCY